MTGELLFVEPLGEVLVKSLSPSQGIRAFLFVLIEVGDAGMW